MLLRELLKVSQVIGFTFKYSKGERVSLVAESIAIAGNTPGPDYKVIPVGNFKKRSMSIKIDVAKTGRTEKITKGHGTDFFETNIAH